MISIADLANVKKLTIPEGVVKKIRVNDIYVWEEATNEVTYTPIEYIQFTGSQRIDTNLYCNQNTKIEIVFTRESSASKYLYAALSDGNKATVSAYLGSSAAWRFGNTYKGFTLSTGESNIHTMIVNKSGITYNGTLNKYGSTVSNFTTPVTLTIGSAKNSNGSYGTTQFVGKIYSFKMYNGSTLVADYVPSISSEGEYGFFDNVTGDFKPSETDTPFNNETATFAINTLDLNEFDEIELSEIVEHTELM